MLFSAHPAPGMWNIQLNFFFCISDLGDAILLLCTSVPIVECYSQGPVVERLIQESECL